ncbi:MAG: exonuclease domain-containing protein [Actinomyces sp.]|uniref:exonuclease domain-containing protein n=1 Tax=Actinomyces sp. TaxID=29317 RepID=UPI0026DD0EBB|nr:exonuclease domain-containing protein [Actinomyces sp.]MDO4242495.1 exonuclease domain-containing protein [Actinomyces sp.]
MNEHHPGRTTSPSLPWPRGPVLGFDTETTGVDPRADRLVTAALVSRDAACTDGERVQRVETWLADPGVEIPPGASAVHGVTTQRARAEGRPVAEVLAEVAERLASAMSQQVPVVAFNASYDLTLMESELARHGLPTVRERLGRDLGPVIDPLVLDRAVDRYRKGKRRLEDLCRFYGVRTDSTLHTAEVDVAAALDLLEEMARRHPRLAGMGLADLMAFQAREHRRWAESFNRWLARQNPGRPGADPSWPLPEGV